MDGAPVASVGFRSARLPEPDADAERIPSSPLPDDD
jgi:hypothetical protein